MKNKAKKNNQKLKYEKAYNIKVVNVKASSCSNVQDDKTCEKANEANSQLKNKINDANKNKNDELKEIDKLALEIENISTEKIKSKKKKKKKKNKDDELKNQKLLSNEEMKNLALDIDKMPIDRIKKEIKNLQMILFLKKSDEIEAKLSTLDAKILIELQLYIKSNKSIKEEPLKPTIIRTIKETYDTINYRAGYPLSNVIEDSKKNSNFQFLTGKIKCIPDGDYISEILKNWWGNYDLLETHHGYIQWLFPIRQQGMNSSADPLQLHELKRLKNLPEVIENLKKSYEMMLDFYGMAIENHETGELRRSDNYKDRYANLLRRSHNYLRITRILKCLGEFELDKYQIEFLKFLIMEVFVSGELMKLSDSLKNFWIHTIKNDRTRNELLDEIETYL